MLSSKSNHKFLTTGAPERTSYTRSFLVQQGIFNRRKLLLELFNRKSAWDKSPLQWYFVGLPYRWCQINKHKEHCFFIVILMWGCVSVNVQLLIWPLSIPRWDMSEYEASMEWYWHVRTMGLEEKFVPVPQCRSQIPCG